MRIHHREQIVNEAELKIEEAINEATKDLTPGEYLRVLSSVLTSRIGTFAKHTIREERHPENPEKPGGRE